MFDPLAVLAFAPALVDLAHLGHIVEASSSNSDTPIYLLLLGPAAGIGFYTMIYLRYRNTDKRYDYEHRTSSEISDPRGSDQIVGSEKGLRNSRIQGDNSREARRRLGRNTVIESD